MTQTLEAIYENGNFRPLKAPQLAEGQFVQLVIQSQSATSPDEILLIAASVYEGLSEPEIQAVEQIAGDLPVGIFANAPYFAESLKQMREERELDEDNPAYT
jgi:predicted DNA-binding antitoxin AbrB/MazE fold protein